MLHTKYIAYTDMEKWNIELNQIDTLAILRELKVKQRTKHKQWKRKPLKFITTMIFIAADLINNLNLLPCRQIEYEWMKFYDGRFYLYMIVVDFCHNITFNLVRARLCIQAICKICYIISRIWAMLALKSEFQSILNV